MEFEKKLHERFAKYVQRLLYNYGEGGAIRSVERDGLKLVHGQFLFSASLNDFLLMSYKPGTDTIFTASDRKLREAMRAMEAMFVLEDLANL